MNIEIISSGCNELANARIFEKLRTRDKNLRHIVIAPDRSLFSLESRLFDELQEECFFDVDVMSITRLSKRLLSKLPKQNILTKQSGIALVKKLLVENKDRLITFGKAVDFMGFATELFETICLYKSCNISPDGIYTDDSTSYSNMKQKDIQLIYAEYEKYLQNDYTDSLNQLKLFASSIDESFCENTVFYFIEFDDFTAIMYQVIEKLARFSRGLYITCCYSRENNGNIYSNKVYGDLVELFKSHGLPYTIDKVNSFGDASRDILLRNVLSYEPQVYDGDLNQISINSFDSIEDEIRYNVATIYSQIIQGSGDFSNYCIVVPSIEDYMPIMKREFALYGIPYYFDRSEILANHPLPRLIFDICNLVVGDFQLSDYLSVLKSPLLNFDIKNVLDIDTLLRRLGAVGEGCLTIDIEDTDISGFVDVLKKCRYYVKNDNTYCNYHTQVISSVRDYILDRIDTYLSGLDVLQHRLYEQVVNKISSIDNDFLSVFSMNFDTFEKFYEIYRSYFESTNLSLPPITSNTLFIADFNASYISPCKYLFILGCNEGKLPKYQLDNGIVTDDEIASLPNGNQINPTISMLNKRKTFKLFDILFRYREHLYLSYTQVGGDGKMYPNSLVNSLKIIGHIEDKKCSPYLDAILRSYREIDVDNIIFNNLTYRIARNNVIDYARDWQVYQDSEPYRKLLSTLVSTGGDDMVGLIGGDSATTNNIHLDNVHMLKDNMTSVSQIECYYSCPYKHFVRYGLKLKESLGDTLQPNDIGTIIHDVLRRVVPEMVRGTDMERIHILSEQYLVNILKNDEYSVLSNPKNIFVIKSLKKELRRICNAIYDEIVFSQFKPKFYEYRFGQADFVVSGVGIKGSIDRVDVRDGDFIIIDYKTGDSQFKNYNDVYSGKKLQLLVYARAYEEKTNQHSIGAFYLPITNNFGDNDGYRFRGVMVRGNNNFVGIDTRLSEPGYKSNVLDLRVKANGEMSDFNFHKNMCLEVEDYRYLIDFAIRKVKEAIHNIQHGDITPRPIKDDLFTSCKYCKYLAICNFKDNNYNVVKDIGTIAELKEREGADGGI